MENVKYITFKNEFGIDDIVIFSKHVVHSEMARNRRILRNPLGAGFIRFDVESDESESDIIPPRIVARCYGKSVTMGLESRGEEDSEIARKMLKLG